MTNYFIAYDIECPNCGAMQHIEDTTDGYTDGDIAFECQNCSRMFVIIWSLSIEADIYRCDENPSEVQCEYKLSKYDPKDIDDDDGK